MNSVKLIHDEEELKWFFDNIIPQLKPTEVIFLSLSARNKYLTDEEKVALELGRTEMFSKIIVRERNWERFIRTIRKLECDEEGYVAIGNSPWAMKDDKTKLEFQKRTEDQIKEYFKIDKFDWECEEYCS